MLLSNKDKLAFVYVRMVQSGTTRQLATRETLSGERASRGRVLQRTNQFAAHGVLCRAAALPSAPWRAFGNSKEECAPGAALETRATRASDVEAELREQSIRRAAVPTPSAPLRLAHDTERSIIKSLASTRDVFGPFSLFIRMIFRKPLLSHIPRVLGRREFSSPFAYSSVVSL